AVPPLQHSPFASFRLPQAPDPVHRRHPTAPAEVVARGSRITWLDSHYHLSESPIRWYSGELAVTPPRIVAAVFDTVPSETVQRLTGGNNVRSSLLQLGSGHARPRNRRLRRRRRRHRPL